MMRINERSPKVLQIIARHIQNRKCHPCTEHALQRLAERSENPNSIYVKTDIVYYDKERKRLSFVCKKYIYVFSFTDKTLITVLNNNESSQILLPV